MGTNFFPTKKRKWPGFCERKHKTVNGEDVDYYYRMTACNLLNTQIDLPLDAEPILPGENEVASAKRMIERLCNNCTRFFDVIVADALLQIRSGRDCQFHPYALHSFYACAVLL